MEPEDVFSAVMCATAQLRRKGAGQAWIDTPEREPASEKKTAARAQSSQGIAGVESDVAFGRPNVVNSRWNK